MLPDIEELARSYIKYKTPFTDGLHGVYIMYNVNKYKMRDFAEFLKGLIISGRTISFEWQSYNTKMIRNLAVFLKQNSHVKFIATYFRELMTRLNGRQKDINYVWSFVSDFRTSGLIRVKLQREYLKIVIAHNIKPTHLILISKYLKKQDYILLRQAASMNLITLPYGKQ